MTSKRRIPADEARNLAEPDRPFDLADITGGAVGTAGGEPEGQDLEVEDLEDFEGFDDDVEVLEYDVVGAQFTIDIVVARLLSEGVEIVRSSPFEVNVTFGGIARLGEHKLIFKASDKEAVGVALQDAGLL